MKFIVPLLILNLVLVSGCYENPQKNQNKVVEMTEKEIIRQKYYSILEEKQFAYQKKVVEEYEAKDNWKKPEPIAAQIQKEIQERHRMWLEEEKKKNGK